MSERYLTTGAQLGMLISLSERDERQKVVDEIIDKQFVGNSTRKIEDDVRSVSKIF